jgi:predicted metal-dependent HD superfamily phosphohydrolase
MSLTTINEFTQLWKRIGATTDSVSIYNDLIQRYREPHRFYHNINHIQYCLFQLSHVRTLTDQPNAIETSIWFHDSIYDPQSNDNEEKSAFYAEKQLREAQVSHKLIQLVYEMILKTKHRQKPENTDVQMILDIDLSILGSEKQVYDKYETSIRREYIFLDKRRYAIGRIKVLKDFLERERIYFTKYFSKRYEKKARMNIKNTIESLQKQT